MSKILFTDELDITEVKSQGTKLQEKISLFDVGDLYQKVSKMIESNTEIEFIISVKCKECHRILTNIFNLLKINFKEVSEYEIEKFDTIIVTLAI